MNKSRLISAYWILALCTVGAAVTFGTITAHMQGTSRVNVMKAASARTITGLDACVTPSTVYVDDSWVGVTPGTDPDGPGPATNFGCDSFATIQGGVNGVTTGGTVIVNDGTYIENVTIPKPLTLTGAGAATVTLIPATSNPNCGGGGGGSLCAGASNLILVGADNVTISGLTLDGDNPALPGGFNVGGANVDARNGIITNHLAGVFQNLTVHHTTVRNIYLRGMYASTGGSFNFHHNIVQNVQAEAASIAMFNFGGAGVFDNNIVSAANDGISSNHSTGSQYTNNSVTTSASGIHTDNAGDSGGTFDTISGNTVANSTTFGYGIWVFVPYKTVHVQNNTVTNVDVGHAVFGDSGVTTSTKPGGQGKTGRTPPKSANASEPDSPVTNRPLPSAPPTPPYAALFTGNTIDGQNKANSTGVYFTTSQIGFGSGNPKVAFTSNTVINNVDGFYLEAETGFTLETAASFNRIVGNTNSQVTQLTGAGFTGTLNGSMENNWWGCNAGPNNAGCGSVAGAGVDFNPWLVLGVSASPNPIGPGGTTTVTADMTHNSDTLAPSAVDFVPQVGVSFTSTQGTIMPAGGTITSGQAASLFTSTGLLSGTACAMVDSQNTCTNITVTLPSFSIDDVTHDEGNGGPGTTSYTFTITKTGATTFNASVDYATVNGSATAPSDFTAIPTTNIVFLPADTTKQVTVLVNGDLAFEPTEAFTVHLSNPSAATIADADGTGTITNDDAPCVPPSTVYVDDNWIGVTPGTDPDGGGPATNFGCDSFATIQEGVNGVATGGTVIVAAGTYIENPSITRAMTLKGAQFGVDARNRVATESIVRTNGNQNAVFSVTGANNVTIDGFSIDGDDPGVTGTALASGDDANVLYGVRPTGAVGNLNVSHNIIKHAFIGLRSDVASQGNVINQNSFDSIGNFDFGYCVSIRNNFYADVTNNKMTRAWTGVHINNHNGAGGPASFNITGNEIHSYAGGILYWLQFNQATGATINNNQMTAEAGAVANNFGVLIVSNQDAVNSTFTNNTITGHNYGIGLFNVPTTNTITLGSTNSITGSTLAGVFLTDNLNFNPVGTTNFLAGGPGAASTVNVNGMSISGNTGDGVKVEGVTNLQTVSATGDTITGTSGARGLEVAGGFGTANVTSSTITGFGAGIALASSSAQVVTAHFNRIISTTTAIDNPNSQTPNLENNWWGCNAGPGNTGCGAVTGTGADFNPWIVLRASATPNSIAPGGMSTIAADMTHNSDNVVPPGTLPNIPDSFSATNGTMNPTTGTIIAGADSSTFTSTNSSNAVATVTVDNQQVNVPITVTPPSFSIDDVTHLEGNGGPGTTSYTFTITKTGGGAASVDYATADGSATSPSDYTAIPTTTVNFLSADTTKQITVLVNGDTSFEADEAFTVHLSNAVGGTITDADGTGTITNDDACAAFATVYVDDNWVGTPVGSDPDGVGPATSFGCDSFATIQGGVTAVTAGGTVIVADGTYTENVTITKAMTLKGAQFGVDARDRAAAESIVIPAVPSTATFTVAFNGLITIDGFSFSGGTSGTQGCIFTSVGPNDNMQISNNRFSGYSTAAIWMNRGGQNITIDRNVLDGSNINAGTQAIFANGPQSFAGLFITNNNVINNAGRYGFFVDGANNVGESATRAALISGNLFDNNLQGMNLGSRSFGKLGAPLLGTYAGTISNNTFSNHTANGIQGGIQHVLVSGNTFTNNAVSGLALTSFGNAAVDRGAQNSAIISNTFTNNGNGGNVNNHEALFFTATQGAGLISTNQAHFNRFIGNFQGIRYTGAETINVENNWFGCNAGPGGGGCDVVSGASLDFNPWIVLGVSASPNSIGPGGTSTVTADMTHNSDSLVPVGGTVPLMPVAFSATQGTMTPPTGTITAGQATSLFTSTSLLSGTGCATVDNQLICTAITVTVPAFTIDDVTHNEGNAGTTAFTFTITKTGATAFNSSVDYATVNGSATAPSDFTAIPTTNVVFLPADTTKQVTVLVNGDTMVEPTEAFTVHLSNPVGATIADADGTGTITNDDACAVFATVYVDDNWTGTPLGTDPDGPGPATTFGCDSFATIQEGVNAVAFGGQVIVRAGTYAEAVLINKPLMLLGAQAGQNANTRFAAFVVTGNGPKANPAVESVITAAATAPASGANDTLHVMASNVTIDGFVVDGNNPSLAQGGATVVGGINTDSRRAIQTEDGAGNPFPANNVTVKNNVIQNFAQRGVELINGTASNTAPATTGNLITLNRVRNFGLDGIVLAFNAYADITFNTVDTNDAPTEAGIWVQDFLNTGTPHAINITNNTVTVGQDTIGGIWANLAYLPAININNNTVNAAASVTSGSDFTYGIYITSLRPGSNASLSGNIVGSSGGTFDRGIALWNLGSGQTTTVTGGTVRHSVKGVSLHDNDPNFGLAGSNSVVDLSGVSIAGPVSGTTVGILVDASGSTGDTVAMQISGNTSVSGCTTGISVVGANASANIHDNSASIHDNTVGIDVSGGFTITGNNLFANATGLRFSTGAGGTAHFNRIISTTTAIDNPNSLTLNLENNWWGCNAGPGNTGCGAVTGTGADFNPWIVLRASATPNSIAPGGMSTIAADMTHNSDNVVPAGTLPNIPDSFSATNGTMNPTTGTIIAGADSSTFTSTNGSNAVATVTVDNQQVNVPITVNAPTFTIDDVSHNEGNAGTTAFVFTVTKTGVTALGSSVSFQTQDGSATLANNDYQTNSGSLNFLAMDATKQITVLVNGDTTVEPNETFTVHLSAAVNATISDADGTGAIVNDDCSFSLSSNSQNFSAAGGMGSVNVITATGCAWTAVSNDAFITVNSGTPGSGNGAVGYTVAANTGGARMGTITIAGLTFTVTQDGGCTFTLSRDHQSFPGQGGPGSVNVTASDPGCAWTASTTSLFITITSGGSGTGNGAVQYTVAINPGPGIRSDIITIAGHVYTVYQGIDFLDVPTNDLFYTDIGKLAARGVTLGCGNGNYCPNDSVLREQMSAFILRAKGEFNPPIPASQRFTDVPPANVFYNFIDRLAVLGITVGCNPPTNDMYCPGSAVTREQMSAFLLRGLGEFNPPTPASQRFNDVPPANVFYNFIDRMAVLNITLGCTPDHLFYCPSDPVTRAQMAAFLVRAFDL